MGMDVRGEDIGKSLLYRLGGRKKGEKEVRTRLEAVD